MCVQPAHCLLSFTKSGSAYVGCLFVGNILKAEHIRGESLIFDFLSYLSHYGFYIDVVVDVFHC